MNEQIKAVLDWWFGEQAKTAQELGPKSARWFREGARLDPEVREKFGALTEQALEGGLTDWESTLEGRVALIIVLDQFTRHVFRNQARMCAGDARAQRLSRQLFDSGEGRELRLDWRHFSMMPMVHAEDLALQTRSVEEADAMFATVPEALKGFYALTIEQSRKYLDVITRFGRFPHRNEILGRTTTDEEKKFMETFVGPPRDFAKKS